MPDFDFATLVTDRSAADLETLRDMLASPVSDWTAEELARFNQAASKGAYNYTDLNRVTACMDYLNEVLTGLGYETGYQRIQVPHEEEGGLPDGYTELEYIQSTGTQYINTGFQPNQNTEISATAYLTAQDAGAWLFGARNANSVATFGFLTYENAYRSDYNTDQNKSIPATYSDPFDIDKNKNQTQINGETEAISTAGTFQCNYPLILFANNTGGNISGFGSGKIYQLSIYDNGTLVRDFIPCRNPSGEIGLYDTVNSQFYKNEGSGIFVSGPRIDADPNTLLLLHGETLTDSSGYEVPITNHGVVVSDAQSKFGGKSLYFNGAAYISLIELIPRTGDFTVDWWEYVVDRSATRFAQSINGGCGGICAGGANNINELYISSTGTTWNITNGFDAFSTTENSWVHWALVRNNDIWTTYRNGIQLSQMSAAGTIYSNGAGLVIGSFLYDSSHYFSGYIDEFRISNVARWTTNFTPPTEPYDVLIPQPPQKNPYVWYEADIQTASQMAQYLENVAALRGVLTLPETIPVVPRDMVGLTQREANTIESILGLIQSYLSALQQIFLRCGAAVCGGPGFYFIN